MPYERINIQLAVKLVDGGLPPIFCQKLNEIYTPSQLQTIANMQLIDVIKAMIRRFKEYSEKINEEETTIARRHICEHDIDPHGACIEVEI